MGLRSRFPRTWRFLRSVKYGPEALRRFFLFEETVIVSYPKCGRTWLRLMLGKLLADHYGVPLSDAKYLLEPQIFSHIDPRVPEIDIIHDDKPQLKRASDLSRDKTGFRDARVVFLVRDPRDVLVSNFYQEKYREVVLQDSVGFSGEMSEFLRHEIHGLETIVAYFNIWAESRAVPRAFLLLRYEDMHRNAKGELERVLEFLDVRGVDDDCIENAVEEARFENMKKLESADALSSGRLRMANVDDPDSAKVRKGCVGGYREELSTEDREYADRYVREQLDPFFDYA